MWTILEALNWTEEYLAKHSEKNPRLAAQWLLEYATGLQRIELYTHFDKPLSDVERGVLRESIKRRVAGEPLQYISGSAPFRYLELTVAPGVLIPRPETELLVDLILKETSDHLRKPVIPALSRNPVLRSKTPSVEVALATEDLSVGFRVKPGMTERKLTSSCLFLDVCTGSGNIAISLATELVGSRVIATDISAEAVAIAQMNAQTLSVGNQVSVIQDDLAESLVGDSKYHASFDAVVSNPPYIPTGLLTNLPYEIAQYEPTLALDGGVDGLDFFKRILEQAAILLKPGGLLACELHEDSLEVAAALIDNSLYSNIQIHQDLTGRQRFITAIRSN